MQKCMTNQHWENAESLSTHSQQAYNRNRHVSAPCFFALWLLRTFVFYTLIYPHRFSTPNCLSFILSFFHSRMRRALLIYYVIEGVTQINTRQHKTALRDPLSSIDLRTVSVSIESTHCLSAFRLNVTIISIKTVSRFLLNNALSRSVLRQGQSWRCA